jgi:hypothetical protein
MLGLQNRPAHANNPARKRVHLLADLFRAHYFCGECEQRFACSESIEPVLFANISGCGVRCVHTLCVQRTFTTSQNHQFICLNH